MGHIGPAYRAALRDTVTFENHDIKKSCELPSAVLLDCHCRLAKILHASGMARAFEHDFDRWDSIKASIHALSEDGQTDIAKVLDSAIGLCRYVSG